jgi:hypothetical protein
VEQQLRGRLQRAQEALALSRWAGALRAAGTGAGILPPAAAGPETGVYSPAGARATTGLPPRWPVSQGGQQDDETGGQQPPSGLARCDSLEQQEARVAALQARLLERTRDARKRALADQERELLRQLREIERGAALEEEEGPESEWDTAVSAAPGGHQAGPPTSLHAVGSARPPASEAIAAAAGPQPAGFAPAADTLAADATATDPEAAARRQVDRQLSERSQLWGAMVAELQGALRQRLAAAAACGGGASAEPSAAVEHAADGEAAPPDEAAAAAAVAAAAASEADAVLTRVVAAGVLDDLVSQAAEVACARACAVASSCAAAAEALAAAGEWHAWRSQWASASAANRAAEATGPAAAPAVAATAALPGPERAAARHLRQELSSRSRLWGLMVSELEGWFASRGGPQEAAAQDGATDAVAATAAAAAASEEDEEGGAQMAVAQQQQEHGEEEEKEQATPHAAALWDPPQQQVEGEDEPQEKEIEERILFEFDEESEAAVSEALAPDAGAHAAAAAAGSAPAGAPAAPAAWADGEQALQSSKQAGEEVQEEEEQQASEAGTQQTHAEPPVELLPTVSARRGAAAAPEATSWPLAEGFSYSEDGWEDGGEAEGLPTVDTQSRPPSDDVRLTAASPVLQSATAWANGGGLPQLPSATEVFEEEGLAAAGAAAAADGEASEEEEEALYQALMPRRLMEVREQMQEAAGQRQQQQQQQQQRQSQSPTTEAAGSPSGASAHASLEGARSASGVGGGGGLGVAAEAITSAAFDAALGDALQQAVQLCSSPGRAPQPPPQAPHQHVPPQEQQPRRQEHHQPASSGAAAAATGLGSPVSLGALDADLAGAISITEADLLVELEVVAVPGLKGGPAKAAAPAAAAPDVAWPVVRPPRQGANPCLGKQELAVCVGRGPREPCALALGATTLGYRAPDPRPLPPPTPQPQAVSAALPPPPPANAELPRLAFGDFSPPEAEERPCRVDQEEEEGTEDEEEGQEEEVTRPEESLSGSDCGGEGLLGTLKRGDLQQHSAEGGASSLGAGAGQAAAARDAGAAGFLGLEDDEDSGEFAWGLPPEPLSPPSPIATRPCRLPDPSGAPPSGLPAGRRTPPAPPPRVEASQRHVAEYVGAVMAAWLGRHGGRAPDWLPAGCEPLSLEGFLALEHALDARRTGPASRAAVGPGGGGEAGGSGGAAAGPEEGPEEVVCAPPVGDAQHIFHKALYDAANEAICRLYERLGRTQVGRALGPPPALTASAACRDPSVGLQSSAGRGARNRRPTGLSGGEGQRDRPTCFFPTTCLLACPAGPALAARRVPWDAQAAAGAHRALRLRRGPGVRLGGRAGAVRGGCGGPCRRGGAR